MINKHEILTTHAIFWFCFALLCFVCDFCGAWD
jgi:hypothetical protein